MNGMRPAQANKGSVDLGMNKPPAAKAIPSQLPEDDEEALVVQVKCGDGLVLECSSCTISALFFTTNGRL